MEDVSSMRRIAGGGLVLGAVGWVLAGALHPSSSAATIEQARIEILNDPIWGIPHWIALVTFLLFAVTAWALVDAGVTRRSVLAQAGARLAIVVSLFMAVQAAAEVAAPSALPALVAGEPAPIIETVAAMQTVGWPAFSAGWILLAVGCGRSLAPRAVVALGATGAAALAVAGVLVEGFGVIPAAVLFPVGGLLALWLAWAGVTLLRERQAEFAAAVSTQAAETGTRA